MNIKEVLKSFSKAIGLINYEMSVDEFFEINEIIQTLPEEERKIGTWQGVAQKVLKGGTFLLNDGVDNSDINSLQKKILKLLKEEK